MLTVGYKIVFGTGKTGYIRNRVNPTRTRPDPTREMPTRTRPDPRVRIGIRVYPRVRVDPQTHNANIFGPNRITRVLNQIKSQSQAAKSNLKTLESNPKLVKIAI